MSLILSALISTVTGRGADEHDPAVEKASFEIAEGFDVNLFASEKEGVLKPIQMRFDPRGRLWVIGSTVYPQIQPGEKPNDKVLILEDTDRDGHADKTTVFADGLMIPTGLELVGGGAYVGHGTELLFLKDNNGDGKADERRVVLRGFGTGDNHQNINSFRWGPSGELWMSQGLHNHSQVETPWGIIRLEQAGLWRFRPHLMRIEGFYGFGHEPQNPWGFVFTRWGDPIVLAGNNSSPIYSVPGLVANRRDDPPPLIWKNGRGRKVSGGEIVENRHFPEAWQGALIMGGYINNAVWTVKVVPDGAGFALEDLPPLIKSTNRNFRPVDVRFGPDGALYLCDWYNPIIGHYQASFRHPDRDKAHGRIWRVTARGRPLNNSPSLDSMSIAKLLEQLQSADSWTRHFAKRVLADRPRAQVVRALDDFVSRRGLSEHTLVEALGVYASHDLIASNLLSRLSRANDPNARAYAAYVTGLWASRLTNALSILRPLVDDPHPRVRLNAIVACTYVPKAEAMETAAIAADMPADRFISYALNQAVFSLKPYWLPALNSGKLNLEDKIARLELLLRADGTKDSLGSIRDLLTTKTLKESTREIFLHQLADKGEAKDLTSILLLKDPSLEARILPTVRLAAQVRNLRPEGNIEALLQPLIESSIEEVRGQAMNLAAIWNQEGFRPLIQKTALDEKQTIKARRSAIEALGRWNDPATKNVFERLAGDPGASIQSAAIASLAALDLSSAAPLAAEALAHEKYSSGWNEIFTAFLLREGGATKLSQTLEEKKISPKAAAAGLELMSASGRRNEGLARLLMEVAGQPVENKMLSEKDLPAFTAEVRANGNVKRGEEIFRRPTLGCVACHLVNGEGGKTGPDLSALGTAQPIDFIIGAIVKPQKEVKEGYVSISVTTKAGEEFQGFLVRENAEEMVLHDALQGREVRLRRSNVKEKREIGSIMPEGLVDSLTRAEFRDLVRFLSELGRVR